MNAPLIPPRVSILIPNFNNGRGSSVDGRNDAIGNLLHSLRITLERDPTPFEVLAFDDGSTDDSLATLRAWSKKTWPDGRPFLDLVEGRHCGVLAKTANTLSRLARGDILARLDGDVICLTDQWVAKLCKIFETAPEKTAVVGPKQLSPDMTIRAFGDAILHPNGYIHLANGLPRHAVKHPLEVDHVMGCFYCYKKSLFEELGGFDEKFLRGQTIDFGLRARLAGHRCFAVPDIEFVHAQFKRKDRPTRADTPAGVEETLRTFEAKWGFSRLTPDLDVVRRRYVGTPLLWNRKWLAGQGMPPREKCTRVETSSWVRFTHDAAFEKKIKYRAGVVMEVIQQAGRPRRLVQVGAGEGLLLHILANWEVPCLGLDPDPVNVDLARRFTQPQKYRGERPIFDLQSDACRLPLPDGQTDLLVIVDLLEYLPNPVALLKEARRVLAPDKHLVVISQRKTQVGDPSDPRVVNDSFEEHRYLWGELLGQIHHLGGLRVMVKPDSDDPAHDMTVVAGRVGESFAELPIPVTPGVLTARPIAGAA